MGDEMFKYVGLKDVEDKKLSELTVNQLKDIIREIVSEEIAKVNFVQPLPAIPPQPFYYNVEPWGKEYEVTYDTKTTLKKDSTIKG